MEHRPLAQGNQASGPQNTTLSAHVNKVDRMEQQSQNQKLGPDALGHAVHVSLCHPCAHILKAQASETP